jgi:hypothetical protein
MASSCLMCCWIMAAFPTVSMRPGGQNGTLGRPSLVRQWPRSISHMSSALWSLLSRKSSNRLTKKPCFGGMNSTLGRPGWIPQSKIPLNGERRTWSRQPNERHRAVTEPRAASVAGCLVTTEVNGAEKPQKKADSASQAAFNRCHRGGASDRLGLILCGSEVGLSVCEFVSSSTRSRSFPRATEMIATDAACHSSGRPFVRQLGGQLSSSVTWRRRARQSPSARRRAPLS